MLRGRDPTCAPCPPRERRDTWRCDECEAWCDADLSECDQCGVADTKARLSFSLDVDNPQNY